MALSIVQLYARSGWRARAVFAGGNPSSVQPGDFAVTRQDGGPCTVAVGALQVIDGTALELILTERLLPKIVYVLTWSAVGTPFSYALPPAQNPTLQLAGDDPDAEANGVDPCWFSADPGAGGDCQRRVGLPCVQYDLTNRGVLIPGELVQDVTAGANAQALVNSTSSDAQLLQAGAKIETEYRRDQRVEDASVNVAVGTEGQCFFGGQVKTRSGKTTPVRST